MLIPTMPHLNLRIDAPFTDTHAKATKLNTPVLASLNYPLDCSLNPIDIFTRCLNISNERFFWVKPSKNFWIVGGGNAMDISTNGLTRFDSSIREHKKIMSNATVKGKGPGPTFLGGFRFDTFAKTSPCWKMFPDGLLTLPRWTFYNDNSSNWITINTLVHPKTDLNNLIDQLANEWTQLNTSSSPKHTLPDIYVSNPTPKNIWNNKVDLAINAIRKENIQKIVLARYLECVSKEPIAVEAVLKTLIQSNNTSHIFAIDRNNSCFLGATPEKLIQLHNTSINAQCLAGSINRGSTLIQDNLLQKKLLNSEKNSLEHRIAADWMSEKLNGLCSSLRWNEIPNIVKTPTIQHLATNFSGNLKKNHHILSCVKELHPTPSISGLPTLSAVESIRKLENFDRGWYAGPIGWVNRYGDGEFAVAIRSGIFNGVRTNVYAGAGIVRGSDPEQEYRETQFKFNTLLNALGISNEPSGK